MLTLTQISAVIFLLQAFGVSAGTIAQVRADLSGPQSAPIALVAPDVATSSPAIASVTPSAPAVVAAAPIGCSLSLSQIKQDGKNPFIVVSWDFTEGATGVISAPAPLHFYGNSAPFNTPLNAHSYNMGKVGFYSNATSVNVNLNINENGAVSGCGQGMAL